MGKDRISQRAFGSLSNFLRRDSAAVNAFGRFKTSRDGNITIMFGFMVGVLLLFTGGAVDFSRYNSVRADLIESMDAAGLAIAQLDALPGEIDGYEGEAREQYLKDYGAEFFYENFKYEDDPRVKDVSIDFVITPQTIKPVASARVKTLFLGMGDMFVKYGNQGGAETELAYLDFSGETEITRRGSGKIELALVLDVTGSMSWYNNGERKIDTLRNSVDNLLQVMYGDDDSSDNIKVGIVPFNAYVNAGGALDKPGGTPRWDDDWGDEDALATYHGARYFHVDEDGNVDMNTKVNHYRLFDSVTNGAWMGCVESRPYPLDEIDTVPGEAVPSSMIINVNDNLSVVEEPNSRMRTAFERAPALSLPANVIALEANSRWVPMFAADEPDCFSSSPNCHGNWTDWESYVDKDNNTIWIEMTGFKFDDPGEDGMTVSHYYNRFFIDDEDYADRNEGPEAARYHVVVDQFRDAVGSGSAFEDFLISLDGDGPSLSQGKEEYIARQAYVGWWDPASQIYRHKYNLNPSIDESISDTDGSMLGPNKDCPAAILPLTNSRTDVEDHMEQLFPNGYTNSANGAIWGHRVLSPQAPFVEGEEYDNSEWQKAVVIMTDGVNTNQFRDTHFRSRPSTHGYAIEERLGAGVDQASVGGAYRDDDMRDQFDEKLLRACRRMKQDGILVYTIVFALDDDDTEEVFETCATSPAEPYYFKAPTAAQLETAFGEIAQDLVNLHVSR